jgi:hypothetical protein
VSSRSILLSVLLLAAQPVSSTVKNVWFCFSDCGARQLALQVTFDGASLYSSKVPICQASPASKGEETRISLVLKPRRDIKWKWGNRDDNPITPAGHRLLVELWEAGADSDALLIGVSVSDGHQIYENTIHIAFPEKSSSTEIATGLVVSTTPAPAGK